MSKTLWNRPLNWGEAELHFPGCGAAWDMLVESMTKFPEDPRLMAVFKYDHVPCPKLLRDSCRICLLPGNDLLLTASISEYVKFTYRPDVERWEFTGKNTY